jgi:hypothetical protein
MEEPGPTNAGSTEPGTPYATPKPEAVPDSGAIVGWAPPTYGAGASKRTVAMLWLVALPILAISGYLGWVAAQNAGEGDAYALGSAIGRALAPLLIVGAIAFVVGLVRRRVRPVMTSIGVPVAVILLGVVGITQLVREPVRIGDLMSDGSPPSKVDAATRAQIAFPYSLREAPAETADAMRDALASSGEPIRSFEARQIVLEGDVVGMLMIADQALPDDAGAQFDRFVEGVSEGAGVEPERRALFGTDVAIVEGPDGAFVTWMEPPLVLLVTGPDKPMARQMAESVILLQR